MTGTECERRHGMVRWAYGVLARPRGGGALGRAAVRLAILVITADIWMLCARIKIGMWRGGVPARVCLGPMDGIPKWMNREGKREFFRGLLH